MADPERVLNEAIEEFATKALSFGRLEELVELARLAYEAGKAQRAGKEISFDRVADVLHPSRLHGLRTPEDGHEDSD